MTNNVDNTVSVQMVATFGPGTESRLKQELNAAIVAAVADTEPSIQKLGTLVSRALEKSFPRDIFNKQFESTIRSMSRGTFSSGLVQELERYRDVLTQVGDFQRKFIADQAIFAAKMAQSPLLGPSIVPPPLSPYYTPAHQAASSTALRDHAVEQANSFASQQAAYEQAYYSTVEAGPTRNRTDRLGLAQAMAVMNRMDREQLEVSGILGHLQDQRHHEADLQAALANRYNASPYTTDPAGYRQQFDANNAAVDRTVAAHRDRMDALGRKYDNYGMYRSEYGQYMIGANAQRLANEPPLRRPYDPILGAKYDALNAGNNASVIDAQERRRQFNGMMLDQRSEAANRKQERRRNREINNRLKGSTPLMSDAHYNMIAENNARAKQRERYNGLPRHVQRRIDRMERRRMDMRSFSHNFRFASQNLGFGIDDAIQSYHYGGIGASTRAASNNLTAIAGMTIPNPMLAAGAVVGLSVFTAALPTLLKKFNLSNEKETELAKVGYNRDGSVSGRIRRSSMTGSSMDSDIDNAFKIKDQMFADQQLFLRNSKFIESKFGPGTAYGENVTGLGSYDLRDPMTRAHAQEAFAFNSGYEQKRNLNQLALNEQIAKIEYAFNNTDYDNQAMKRQTGTEGEHALYRAKNLYDYEQQLKANAAAQEELITGDGQERHLQKLQIQSKLKEDLANVHGNEQAAERNAYERRFYFRDEARSSYGYSDVFSSMELEHDRRIAGYNMNKSLTSAERLSLKIDATRGFKQRHDEAFKNMDIDTQVNNPLGKLQGEFSKRFDELHKMKEAGGISDEEFNTLFKNTKQSYSVAMFEAQKIHGTERFQSDAMQVGSHDDNELRNRMLNNYVRPEGQMTDYETKSLAEMQEIVTNGVALNKKLELQRLGLK